MSRKPSARVSTTQLAGDCDWPQGRNEVQVRAGAVAESRQLLSSRLGDVEKRLSGHAEERQLAESTEAEDRR